MWFVCFTYVCLVFFFFKQKTAYEMRISDWSSDVCSSDLEFDRAKGAEQLRHREEHIGERRDEQRAAIDRERDQPEQDIHADHQHRGAAADIAAVGDAEQVEDRMRDHRRGEQVEPEGDIAAPRSEENTSELQSLMRISYAV